MTGTCQRPDCAVHDDMPCELGFPDFTKCPHYQTGNPPITATPEATDSTGPESAAEDASTQRLPWTGRALGLADMALVSSRSPTRLVGLIGPFNAGKTSLLTAMFTHFAKSGTVRDFDFAGSFTLNGWSQLRGYTGWPSPQGGTFPPHTPDNGLRVPSLLHLAFRKPTGQLRDLLFTDAPGEWFTRWLKNQNAEESRGARWIAENASHFLYVVDREGLASADVGRIRQNTLALARLLSEHRHGRPIIAIWTKSNTVCDEQTEAPIRARLAELFGPHPSFNLHVEDPACVKVLEVLLESPPVPSQTNPSIIATSAFLGFEGVRP